MKRDLYNKNILKSVWLEFCDGIDETQSERSLAFRNLRCRYKLLLLMREVTDDKVADFKRSATRVKQLI